MPIDSQVVNGRIIGPDGAMPSSLEIDDGRIVSVDTETEVWRTVDASGYFVLPGAVQPGDPTGDHVLSLVAQGVTTAIVRLEFGANELAGEIERLAREAILDYCLCWSLPEDASARDIDTARELGICVFEASNDQPAAEIADSLTGAIVRLPATSDYLSEWLNTSGECRLVLTVTSSDELRRALSAKSERGANVCVEVDLALLYDNARAVANAIADGDIDIISSSGEGRALLQLAYGELIENRTMPVSRLVELCSTGPAKAYGLAASKGRLETGADADFVVFDPEQTAEIDGTSVQGRVVYGQLRGDILLFNDELHVQPGHGRMVPGNSS